MLAGGRPEEGSHKTFSGFQVVQVSLNKKLPQINVFESFSGDLSVFSKENCVSDTLV